MSFSSFSSVGFLEKVMIESNMLIAISIAPAVQCTKEVSAPSMAKMAMVCVAFIFIGGKRSAVYSTTHTARHGGSMPVLMSYIIASKLQTWTISMGKEVPFLLPHFVSSCCIGLWLISMHLLQKTPYACLLIA